MSFKIGKQFEDYSEPLFPASYYLLLHRTHYYKSYNQNNPLFAKPGFKFMDKKKERMFYLKLKYRAGFSYDKLNWGNEDQLYRYKSYQTESPVFILIGLGGEPYYPEEIFLIP